MAQVIKIKRGGLANLVATTPALEQGELLLATGSLNGLKSTFFVASASNSPSLPYAKIETITDGPTLGASLDANFEGLLIHSASDNKLYRYSGTQFVELPIAAGSFVGTLPVGNGGTGQNTLIDGAVLVGNGTNAIEQLTLTDGQLLIGNSGNSPSTATLTAGAGMFVTNGAGSITLSVDSGSMLAYYSGSIFSKVSGDIVINSAGVATIQPDSVLLGTDTSGNYVATIANATNGGTTINNSGTETAAVTIALNFGDLTEAAVEVAADFIPFIDGGITGTSRKESIADLVSAVAGTNLTATAGVLSVPLLTGVLSQTSSYLKSASVIGTANEVEVTANGAQGIQIGLPDNVTIAGNLIVNGTTTTLNTDTLNVEDNIISVNYAAGAHAYAGLYALDATGNQTGSFLWDTANNYWIAGLSGSEKRVIRIETNNTFTAAERFVGTKGVDTLDSFVANVDGHYLKYNGSALEVTNVIDGGTF